MTDSLGGAYESESGRQGNSLDFNGKSTPDPGETDLYSLEQESIRLQADASQVSRDLQDLPGDQGLSDDFYGDLLDSETARTAVKTEAKTDLPDSPLEEYQLGRYSPLEQRMRDPVHDFLRESREIKEDLHRLSQIKKGLGEQQHSPSFSHEPSPTRANVSGRKKKHPFLQEQPRKPLDSTDPQTDAFSWERINALLQETGFAPFQLQTIRKGQSEPKESDIRPAFIKILTEFGSRILADSDGKTISDFKADLDVLTEANKRLKSKLAHEHGKGKDSALIAKHQIQELKAVLSAAQEKIDFLLLQNAQNEREMVELKNQIREERENQQQFPGSEHEQAVFKKFFGREAVSLMDSKVLRMIRAYEESRQNRTSPIQRKPTKFEGEETDLRTQLERVTRDKALVDNQRKTLMEELTRVKSLYQKRQDFPIEKDADSMVLAQITNMLALNSPKQLPNAVSKMLQVIRALPNLEHFIKSVTTEVFPSHSESIKHGSEDVIPTLRIWRQKLTHYDALLAFRTKVSETLGLGTQTTDEAIVTFIQFHAFRTSRDVVTHFRSLFEVNQSDDPAGVLNQVFLFVCEMKGFLQVSAK